MTKWDSYAYAADIVDAIDELIKKYGFDNVKYSVTYNIDYRLFYTIRDKDDENMENIS